MKGKALKTTLTWIMATGLLTTLAIAQIGPPENVPTTIVTYAPGTILENIAIALAAIFSLRPWTLEPYSRFLRRVRVGSSAMSRETCWDWLSIRTGRWLARVDLLKIFTGSALMARHRWWLTS